MRKRLLPGVVLAAGLLVNGAAAGQTPVQVLTFDSAWTIINNTHFDSTFNGVDWKSVRTELRPRAEAATTNQQLRVVLLDMLNRLKQSHFSIIPMEVANQPQNAGGAGDTGAEVRWVENALVVTHVDPGSPAEQAGVKTGWILRRAGASTVDSMLALARRDPGQRQLGTILPRIAQARLSGAVGSSVEVEFLDARDQRVTVTMTRRAQPGDPVKFGTLPTFYTRTAARRVVHEGVPVGVIAFNVWMPAVFTHIDRAVDAHRDAQGMVIDLRGNPGGLGIMATGLAGHFVDSAQVMGTMNGRPNRMVFRINPRRVDTSGQRVTPFQGRVAILTDELSASTSEVFAGGLQSLGRVRVFGATTMGAVLPALMDRLPNGDVLYHAIADFVTPDGTRLEGRGVIPDEPVTLKRADLLAGRDAVLEAALRWIASQPRTN